MTSIVIYLSQQWVHAMPSWSRDVTYHVASIKHLWCHNVLSAERGGGVPINIMSYTIYIPGTIVFFIFPSHLCSSPFILSPSYFCLVCLFLFFSIPFIIFALLSLSLHSRNSDPGSQSRLFSPLPTTVRAFIFIARRVQHFLPSSTRVEFCLPTLLSALGNNWCLSRKKALCACVGVRTRDFPISVVSRLPLNHRGRPL